MQPVIYNYRGSDIAFEGEGRLVNATDMAKPFGKRSNDFLRLAATDEYIQAITTRYGISRNEVVRVIQGGSYQGTWFHPRLALRFAQWLSADFALWVDEKMEELLTMGKTSLIDFANPAQIARAFADQWEQRERAENSLKEALPKIEHYDAVMESSDCLSMEQAAKVLAFRGIGRNSLFQFLRDQRIMRSGNKEVRYLPYEQHSHLFNVIQQPFTKPNGEQGVRPKPLIRQKGVEYIRQRLLKAGFQPET